MGQTVRSGGSERPLRVPVTDFKSRIEHYRAKAVEAEARARQASDETSRSQYLEAARSWADLARMTEELLRGADGQ